MFEPINSILSIVGSLVGIAGFAYGLYQSSMRKQIQRLNRARAWEFFRVMFSTFGHLQEYYKHDRPKPVPRHPAMDAAMAQMGVLYPRAIENVIAQYENVTPEDIDEWNRRHQIHDLAVTLFKIKLHDQDAEKRKSGERSIAGTLPTQKTTR